jgi:SAM-dependent methyltransferase
MILVPPEALPYLQMQRGAISDMRGDTEAWLDAYAESVLSEFRCIEPYLPASCDAVLDVGSGLGGINIFLARHFGDQLDVTLLDGDADFARVESHDRTFNDMAIARHFLAMNGVANLHCLNANSDLDSIQSPHFFDLIISLRAWCFHIEPIRYAPFVQKWARPGARIVVDMRHRDKEPERHSLWFREMTRFFRHVSMIHYGVKFETHLFEIEA